MTGGTAGVGRARVREFAGAGYDIAVLARGAAGLAGAAADIEAAGRRALTVECDVADHDAVDAATDRVESELGPIEVWVNVAFVGSLAYFWDTDPHESRRMTEVTYFGQVNGVRSALRVMRPRDRGAIVNVSLAMAYRYDRIVGPLSRSVIFRGPDLPPTSGNVFEPTPGGEGERGGWSLMSRRRAHRAPSEAVDSSR
ncbi:SDR family NAD(P)-dependent oxidoreductase [Allobranchiibius sp. GilTou73]|uniref:SDR family NAD(P)-dependent oxidoreductase n=1 Tax=Allobranchiibius sp. GilTou73 TaxID=2904523 RepID=UPI001F458F9B|nr:SDR family NAD(P)-dependent oxidoreductase [Allobranchiibius sp. GilTou73]UIJ34516.1 SDR family NAD(P)-dependent oxidoreductase [Allobranchiibius sp. GilTou73]